MRFGLLGTGPWASRTHAVALSAHPRAELVGVWGRRPEAAQELAAEHRTTAHRDLDALLADCDAVAVALPPDVQAELAIRAAEAGCHLLLDKPVATTGDTAERLAAAAERAGVRSVVFFTLRFSPETARWIAEQRVTGGWSAGRADWYSPVFGGSQSPYAASPWRQEKGALWDIGPHALSVLLPALGEVEPSGVTAVRGPGDTVHLVLRHVNGASSTVTVTHSVPPAAAGVSAELRGSAGVVRMPEREAPAEAAFGRAIDALMAPERHDCDLDFGVRVTRLLEAADAQLPPL
ncbi:Gfo/Idh/MocA family oxidoreductase [Streptomyces sp. XM4193]|uniref:Gfo/Idh/MocA family protein n=1 Tax=Streptomyces sp. XM4193 TaxID=2929782 RepID=UPI001FF99A89|nr:Gfo/Idh/MocA family oxidoreductase [Streptomyces sp. XM4193]MCK1796206.1 Gfo/Idh/MocA family oxidoreductase [Streptomyces sp. XM4193]